MLKLKDTQSKNAIRYGYLLENMYPYINRTILLFTLAIPFGLLDGIVDFSLRPCLGFVVNGNKYQTYLQLFN